MEHSISSRRKLTRLLIRKRPSYIFIPVVILGLFVLAALFAPLLAPHSPTETNLGVRFQPGFWADDGSWSYPLGADALGRDVLSRLLYGAQVSLKFALLATVISTSVGAVLGLIAGYYGGWIDAIIMRLVDLVMSFPMLLMAMVIVVVLGAGFWTLIIVVGVFMWAFYARLVRGETMAIKEKDYVALARTSGASAPRIIARHIFPNLMHSLVVLATLQVGGIILLEASLSFLGVGLPPPTPAWGLMVAEGRGVITTAWWVTVFPGLAIGAVVLSVNLFGDWLRDKLDPRLRQV